MIILGIVLIVVAGVFGVDVMAKNHFRIRDVTAFGESLGLTSGTGLYVLGAVTGAVVLLGAGLIVEGLRHKTAKALSRRHERKEASRHAEEVEALQAENRRLHEQLEAAGTTEGASRTASGDRPA